MKCKDTIFLIENGELKVENYFFYFFVFCINIFLYICIWVKFVRDFLQITFFDTQKRNRNSDLRYILANHFTTINPLL